MKTKKLPAIGAMMDDCVYLGRILVKNVAYAILQPPKAVSEHEACVWNDSYAMVKGAKSYCDGLSNTKAMAKAGSRLAEWALDKGLYIPSLDEQELQYRLLKPGTQKNSCYARSGINLSVQPPTYPYTEDFPKQTKLKAYRAGGAEAFREADYWSSTQHESNSLYAWSQTFSYGLQYCWHKDTKLLARAVRRQKI